MPQDNVEKPVLAWVRPPAVRRELQRLGMTRDEATKVGRAMDRFAKGEVRAGDYKKLSKDIEEIRVRIDNRIVRVYFGRPDGDLVLLALHANVKKKQNDREAIRLAADRLKKYKRGQWGT